MPRTGVWTYQLARDHPLALVGLAVGVGIAFFFSWLALVVVLSRADPAAIPRWGAGSWLEAGIRTVMLAYTLPLTALGLRAAERAVRELRPAPSRTGPALEEALSRPLQAGSARLRLAGAAGVLALFGLGGLMAPAILGPFPLGGFFWLALFGWFVGRALVAHLHAASALSAVGERWVEIDLLDLRPLQPLVRFGLRLVLLWAIWFAIMATFWLGPDLGHWSNALGLLPLFAIAVAALVVPVRGVHRRVRGAKQTELDRLTQEIRRERENLLGGSGGPESPRLANLIAYRSLIENVREWPFDLSNLVRFGLYMTLGVGSWVGAALVERVLGRAFG